MKHRSFARTGNNIEFIKLGKSHGKIYSNKPEASCSFLDFGGNFRFLNYDLNILKHKFTKNNVTESSTLQ